MRGGSRLARIGGRGTTLTVAQTGKSCGTNAGTSRENGGFQEHRGGDKPIDGVRGHRRSSAGCFVHVFSPDDARCRHNRRRAWSGECSVGIEMVARPAKAVAPVVGTR